VPKVPISTSYNPILEDSYGPAKAPIKDSFRPPSPSYGIPESFVKDSYDPPNLSYEEPIDTFSPSYGVPKAPIKESYSLPPFDSYKFPKAPTKASYSPPKDSYGPPKKPTKDSYSPPSDSHGPSQAPIQDSYSPPSDSYGLLKEAPKDSYSGSDSYGSLIKDSYKPPVYRPTEPIPQSYYEPVPDYFPPQPLSHGDSYRTPSKATGYQVGSIGFVPGSIGFVPTAPRNNFDETIDDVVKPKANFEDFDNFDETFASGFTFGKKKSASSDSFDKFKINIMKQQNSDKKVKRKTSPHLHRKPTVASIKEKPFTVFGGRTRRPSPNVPSPFTVFNTGEAVSSRYIGKPEAYIQDTRREEEKEPFSLFRDESSKHPMQKSSMPPPPPPPPMKSDFGKVTSDDMKMDGRL
jgi:hypothetical protein